MAFKTASLGLLALSAIASSHPSSHSCDSVEIGYQCQPNISHNWGQYSPYFTIASEIPDIVPPECSVTFLQLLERHGARYPTTSKGTKYEAMMEQVLGNVKEFEGKYAFLKDFKYTMGADVLTPFGAQQSYNSGIKLYNRYRDIADRLTPFIRASGEERVITSATNWTAGFHEAKSRGCRHCADPYPYNMVVISEDAGSNNTLDASTCPQYEDGFASTIGASAQVAFADTFTTPIMDRLNADMPGANLTQTQTIYFMDMCPFETVSSATGAISPFCELFTGEEWQKYNYYETLGKFYSDGWGNPLGAAQGVGFVNELIARLTETPVQDHTSTNSTLDSSAATFPLGGSHQFFADFSHDDPMTSIFSAFGFYNRTGQLSNTTVETAAQAHGYASAWSVPFAGRAYIEKQQCSTGWFGLGRGSAEYVRVIVNDRVIPLLNCGADWLGRCKVDDFVESLSYAREGGNWVQCYSS